MSYREGADLTEEKIECLNRLLDLEEIRNLRVGYTVHYDAQDIDRLTDLFTEDAVCTFGAEYGRCEGKAAIRAHFLKSFASLKRPYNAVHVVTNPWVEIQAPDRAIGRWYLLDYLTSQYPETALSSPGGHNNPMLWIGVYEDVCRKEGGRWKIEHLKLSFLWPKRA